MNQTELANRISAETGIPSREVDAVLGALGDQLGQALAKGDRVQIAGLMVADTAERAERAGRNPRTGEAITIPAHRAVRLTPAAALKRAVAEA